MPHREWPPNGDLSAWIAAQFPEGYRGFAVDVGASDGISISSTYTLEKQRGWSVLCIEPNPQFWPRLKELRPFVMGVAVDAIGKESRQTLHIHDENPEAYSSLRPSHPEHKPGPGWSTQQVIVTTLDACLVAAEWKRLDALCVDTEGTEADVLRGLDFERWDPRVVVVESWGGDRPADEFLRALGYTQRWRTAENNCYVKEDAGGLQGA